jgi:hypothetical protein
MDVLRMIRRVSSFVWVDMARKRRACEAGPRQRRREGQHLGIPLLEFPIREKSREPLATLAGSGLKSADLEPVPPERGAETHGRRFAEPSDGGRDSPMKTMASMKVPVVSTTL